MDQELLGARERNRLLLIFSRRIFDSSVGTREPQSSGRSSGTRHTSPAGPERLFDDLLFVRSQPTGQPKPAFGDRASGKPAFVDREFVGVGYDDRSLDHVLQLANVPRPGIGLQPIERPLANALESLARLPARSDR